MVRFSRHSSVSGVIMSDDRGFSYDEQDAPWVFLQWKGTDACFDFHCKCGAHCHFDGDFAYYVECPHCNRIYEMPFILFPREVSGAGVEPSMIQDLEPDGDPQKGRSES